MISTDAKFNSLATSVIEIKKSLHKRPHGGLPSNTIPNPQEEIKAITTRSGNVLARTSVSLPPISSSSKEVERDPETITDQLPPSPAPTSSELPKRNPHQPPIPYPSSLADTLALMPKYAKMLKDLLSDKEKLLGLANTSLTENCSAVLLKKLPEKLRDPGKFLIPCDFPELKKCMALADLGANINLMPLSVWKKLMLPELIPTRMTLELANRSVAYPVGIGEDVCVQDRGEKRGDPEADLREIEYLLNRDPSTDSSPTTVIDIIDPILERFTDEPALIIIDELKAPESSVLLPQLLDCDSALHEELPEIDTLPSFPSENEDKVFNLGILVYGSTYFVTNEVTQDKNLKKKTSSEAFLILEEHNFLSISSD
ncbi:reverse transcriptase domain-containing protein [Tanacetum coccineum]